jgi:hypothetical protein
MKYLFNNLLHENGRGLIVPAAVMAHADGMLRTSQNFKINESFRLSQNLDSEACPS